MRGSTSASPPWSGWRRCLPERRAHFWLRPCSRSRRPVSRTACFPCWRDCAASYLVAGLVGKNSIMTEKIARRGIRTPAEYMADPLEQVIVGDIASKPVVTFHHANGR